MPYLEAMGTRTLWSGRDYRFRYMAEREGFEPPIPVKVYTLSRRAPSATRPSLRAREITHSYYQGTLPAPSRPTPSLNRAWFSILPEFQDAVGHLIRHR